MFLVDQRIIFFTIGVAMHFAIPVRTYGGVTIAFCKNTLDGKWKQDIHESLLEIPFRVDPVDCGNIENSDMGLMIRHNTGQKDVVFRAKGQSDLRFFASVVKKISPLRLTELKGSLADALTNFDEAIVVYVKEDTTEDLVSQKALLSPRLPKRVKVFRITKIDQLTPQMKKDIQEDLHVWILTGQEQSHILLPYNSPNKLMQYLTTIFAKLRYQLKFKYESDDTYLQYKGISFNFFTVYHHSDQEEEVQRNIIDPLINIFKPLFVFVSVDIDKYELPQTISRDSPFPLVVITREGQRASIPVSSRDTPYTIESFKQILSTIVNPEIDNELQDDNLFDISFPERLDIPSTLPLLTTDTFESFVDQHESCLLAFYLHYTLQSQTLLFHLINSSVTMKSAGMSVAIVNCAKYPDVCARFDIAQYPTVKYRKRKNEDWFTYNGVVSNVQLVKLAQGILVQDEDITRKNSITELTPSHLIEIVKADGLKSSLLILVAEKISSELESTFSDLHGYTLYWLNSTRYTKSSDFLIGLSLSPPPVLVLADYNKNLLFRFDLKNAFTQKDITEFLNDISNGNKKPEGEIFPAEWKPVSPPINFPSTHFLSSFKKSSSSTDRTEGKNSGYLDKLPLYADPNRYSSDVLKLPESLASKQSGHNHQQNVHQEL